MSPELDDLLCARYPVLFRDRHADMRESGMCWGFSCGDGWYTLIDTLSGELQRHAEATDTPITAVQVKEKFGTLRMYVRPTDDYIQALQEIADYFSAEICELCGAPGHLIESIWMRTLCAEHAADHPVVTRRVIIEPDPSRKIEEPIFRLPPIATPGWQHLCRALDKCIDNEVRHNNMPPIAVTDIRSTPPAVDWQGGDGAGGRAQAFYNLFLAYAMRVDRETGKPLEVPK